MTKLEDYINSIKLVNCPSDCPFQKRRTKLGIQPALVPPPSKKITGVIVSRDPTLEWLCVYRHAMNLKEANSKRLMLYTSAIPNMLCGRIKQFTQKDCTNDYWEKLYSLIYDETYWTHFNKCYTITGNQKFGFNRQTAKICANNWLNTELKIAVEMGAEFIIVLGRDAQAWIDKNMSKQINEKAFKLIHPSGQNNAIWAQRKARNEKYQERRQKLIDETHKSIVEILNYAELGNLKF
jgi:hypothetical protein